MASRTQTDLVKPSRATRERAEWCLAMLSDHAWNGTDDQNRRENARLRREWGSGLNDLARWFARQRLVGYGADAGRRDITVFNGLSIPRAGLIRLEAPAEAGLIIDGETPLDSQVVDEEGKRILYGVSPTVPGFGLKALRWGPGPSSTRSSRPAERLGTGMPVLPASSGPQDGRPCQPGPPGHGSELVAGDGPTLCQTTNFDGKEQPVTGVMSEVVARGQSSPGCGSTQRHPA